MSENVGRLAEIIKTLAGKGSDLVLTFDGLTLDVIRGAPDRPNVSLKLSGSIKLDVVFVKE